MAAETRTAVGPGSERDAQTLSADEHKHTSVSERLTATRTGAADVLGGSDSSLPVSQSCIIELKRQNSVISRESYPTGMFSSVCVCVCG